MPNEELVQRGYVATGKLKGTPFGDFEELNIGATSIAELVSVGVAATVPETLDYPFTNKKLPKKPSAAKPDRVFLRRTGSSLAPVAVAEHKAKKKLTTPQVAVAAEQALFNGIALGVRVAIVTDGERWKYLDVEASVQAGKLTYFSEARDFNPAVLKNLLAGDAAVAKDPKPLAETVWQIIWHATKEEPKSCLLTFVEIFVLKFLSDNLPSSHLAEAHRFYELLLDPAEFKKKHGTTAIEHYVSTIRPQIKRLFPDKVVVSDPDLPHLFGLETLVSSTSIINGFAFLKSSEQTLVSFNRTFREILDAFNTFGPLTTIDPEFKMRLYETFLKRSARQQKLGQFFTPRNIVRPMIKMARLGKLPAGAVVLDPAAGVGGFVLEPLLIGEALPNNVQFEKGKAIRKVKTVGVDVDANTHILGKANMLLHLAEAVRDPKVTLPALNQAMAETFVLMHTNEALGALENPVRGQVDVLLTNPPYVTQGSKIYREEIANLQGTRNGLDLRDYYDGSGLGLESLFVRYISGALKPGGRGFVILPLGFLNRTEPGPKERLLNECNVIGSIELPRNAFFNTAQPTNILILERRHTEADARPDVFCAVVRSIGETLDWRRTPTPDDNDLDDIADLFVAWSDGKKKKTNGLVKLVPATAFSKDDRWDVSRFWSEEELVELGVRESAVERVAFIEEATDQLTGLLTELEAARAEISKLTAAGEFRSVSLSDEQLFAVRSGDRIRNEDIRANPGDVPVYSCFIDAVLKKGDIDEKWLKAKKIPIETKPLVTIMANGAKAVGRVFVRRERCAITDDVIIVEPKSPEIDLDFLAIKLRSEIARHNYVYEAKLFKGRVQELSVDIPIKAKSKGAEGQSFDLQQQKAIASAINRFDEIRQKLYSLGKWSREVRIS